jgi:RNA ligase (TIGR02306 family)
MERKLASIQKITEIRPIEGSDFIEAATINSWQVVVAKNVGHKVGDLVVYFEIDSYLPVEPEFEFLRKTSYKKMGEDKEGFCLRTMVLRKTISQGLILPLAEAINIIKRRNGEAYYEMLREGQDVTELLGVIKWDPPLPDELLGKAKGYFPGFLKKTDEERIQNLTSDYERWKGAEGVSFYLTEKLNGESISFYVKNSEYGICTRRVELLEPESRSTEGLFWKVSREMQIREKLLGTGRNLCLQGELIGEGISKNPYKIEGHTVRFFNAFDIDRYERLDFKEFVTLISEMGLETVPILETDSTLPENIKALLFQAEGKSVLNPSADREGIVIRSMDGKISFKAISNKFLLEEKE